MADFNLKVKNHHLKILGLILITKGGDFAMENMALNTIWRTFNQRNVMKA